MARASCCLLATALAFITVLPLAAQQDSALFSDAIDVEVVNVEVVVTDKQDRAVTDLSIEDFEVFENGQPVDLTNFYLVEGPAPDPSEVAPGDATAAAQRPAGGTQNLNLVIFIDDLNLRPENRKLIFENLRKDLRASMAAGAQVMLATMSRRVEVVQQLTDDIDQILASLDSVEKAASVAAVLDGEQRMFMTQLARATVRSTNCSRTRPPTSSTSGGGGGGFQGDSQFDEAVRVARDLAINVRSLSEQRYQNGRATVSALAAFSETLGGLPGRKALLYVTDGVPMRPGDSMLEAWIAKYDNWFQQNEDAIRNCSRYPDAVGDFRQVFTSLGSSQFDLHGDFTRLTESASDNRVAFYPVSNSGRNASFVSAANPGSGEGSSGQLMRSAMVAESMSRDGGLLQMADDTGGLAFTGNANVGELVRRLNADFQTFYSLGYTPPERDRKERDNEFFKIEVKVKRQGVDVRHAGGYRDRTWRDRLGDLTVTSALYELESNPLGIQVQRGEIQRQGGRFKVPVLVQIPLGQVQMVSDGGKYKASLSILVVVKDAKGGFSKPRRFDLPIEVPNAQILQARQQAAGFPVDLEMKKDDQVVAVSVRDHIGQMASVLNLTVDLGGGKSDGKKKKKKGRKGR